MHTYIIKSNFASNNLLIIKISNIMKPKFLLLITLVLLAVQGWATPVGAQTTLSHGNNLTTWNCVELSNDVVLLNGVDSFNFRFNGCGNNGFESNAPTLRGAVGVLNGLYTVYSLLQDAYDIYTYFDNQSEWVSVFSPKRTEVIVGNYYELYVTIYAKTDFPIEPHYYSQTDAFDFSSCPDVIYVDDLESNDYYKVLRIKFHPTEQKEYRADIKLFGGDKLADDDHDIKLRFDAVEDPNEKTIYISPATEYHLFSQVNSSDFISFNVKAIGLTGSLNVRLSPINIQDLPDPDCSESDMFSIDGGDWLNISSEKAAQGSNVTVRYSPNDTGRHCAKIIISGINHEDEICEEEILLIGEASGVESSVFVSDNFISFSNCMLGYSYTKPLTVKVNGIYTPPLKMYLTDEDFPGIFSVDWINLDPIIFPNGFYDNERTFNVHFNPTIYGTYRAKIIIEDGNGVLQKTITLIGTTNKPTITATPSTLTFPNVTVGQSVTQTFTVKGTDLLGPLTLVPESTGANCNFTIDKTEISLDQALEGTLVTVTCIPTEDGRLSGRVKISGGGVENPEVVSLSGNAIDPPHIGVNYSSLSFDDITVGEYATKTFKVTGTNLNGSLTLSVTGATDVFSINKTVISNSSVIPCDKKTDFDITNLTDLTNLTVTSANNMPVLSSGISTHAIEKKKIDFSEISYFNNGLVTATITVTYKPLAEGTQTAMVTISGGGAESKTVSLTGHAVERRITLSPAALVFNDVEIGGEEYKKCLVKASNPTGPLTLKLNDETDMYTIYPTSITAEEAKCGKYVTVYYTPTNVNSHIASVSVYGGGAIEEKTISLNGFSVPTAITVTPSSNIVLNDVVVGDYKTETFKVRGSGYTSNLNLNLTGATDVFSINKDVITPEEAENGQDITVTYRPTASGTQTAKVTISGGGVIENKVVDLKGIAIERKIALDQAALTFSKITVGKDTTKTIKVIGTNLNAPLTVKLNDNTGMFSLAGSASSTITISAAAAANGAEVNVTYKPTAVGTHVASITITGGGALEEKIVMLNGSAVKREITTTPSSWDFENVPKNMTRSRNIIVKADNLTGPLTVELTQRPALDFYTIDKTTITPAEAANGATIKLTYKPTAVGTHNATLTISGGGAAEKRVSITGTCVVPVITTNKSSLNFGTCVKGKSYTSYFTVTGTNLTSDLTLSSSNSYFTVSPTTISKEDAALGAKVTIIYKPTATGNHTGTINISSEGVNGSINVSGKSVVPAITPSTTSLDFGNIPVGTTTSKTFTVKGTDLTGSLSLTLSETGTNGSFTVSPTSISGSSAANGVTITVRCTATEAGSISGRIKISGGDAATMTVSLSAKGVEPAISTSTSSLSFGGSTISSKTFKVTGTNLTGDLSLTVTGTNSTNFSVSPSSISSSAAASGKTVTVTCNPKAATSAEAKVKISGGGASPKYVTLKYTKGGVVSISSVEPEGGNEGSNNEFTNVGSLDVMTEGTTDVNELAMNSKIYAEGLNIIIETPIEQKALISDIAGHAWKVNLQAGRNEIPVNASGVYIVRIREKTAKLMLK